MARKVYTLREVCRLVLEAGNCWSESDNRSESTNLIETHAMLISSLYKGYVAQYPYKSVEYIDNFH